RNCKSGRLQLVDFCKEHNVAIDICGKVIVAAEKEEVPRLEAIFERGKENEVEGIELIDEARLSELEPHAKGVAAIHVPCAGIVDFTGVCEKLREFIESKNGEVRFNHKVKNIRNTGNSLKVEAGGEILETACLINCA